MPIIDYKCPNCGSAMFFDSATGTLACNSCGRQDNIEQMPETLKQSIYFEDSVREYQCNSCGAVLMTEKETTATLCSFCGSAVILSDRLSGKLVPAMVIPFSISKDEAIKAFKKWCKNGRLTPSGFMSANRIKGITGMYVPFWLYDLNNNVEVQGLGTRIKTYTQGDYRVTETQHYQVYRKLRLNYNKVPVDAAEKMKDELMDKLEPFPYDQLKGFKTAYLAGYIAEKYSYNKDQLMPRVKDKVSTYIDAYIQASVTGYSTMNLTHKQVDTRLIKADYVLLPVWVIHYDFNKLEHTFAMNGQTGKVVGKPPISKMKVAMWFTGIFTASLISLKLLSAILGGGF